MFTDQLFKESNKKNNSIISSFNNEDINEDNQSSPLSISHKKRCYDNFKKKKYYLQQTQCPPLNIFTNNSNEIDNKENIKKSDSFNIFPNKKEYFNSNNINNKGDIKKSDSLNIFPDNEEYFDLYKGELIERMNLSLNNSNFSPNKKYTPSVDTSKNYYLDINFNLLNNKKCNPSPLFSESSTSSNNTNKGNKNQLFFFSFLAER